MPAVRSNQQKLATKENNTFQSESAFFSKNVKLSKDEYVKELEIDDNVVDLALQSKGDVYFPTTAAERDVFRTSDGKKITSHQWAVYDATRQIPCGKVTTYKHLCAKLGEGSPRSVGSALRNNPFAPYVPCHRVISSDLSLGGFQGEWGTQNTKGSHCSRKVEMLDKEGVKFRKDGKLVDAKEVVWK